MGAVLTGSHIFIFLELPHKVKFTFVSAKACQGLDGHFRGPQIETGVFQTCGYHILHAGGSEKFLIKMLKVRGAHVDRLGHGIYGPFAVRGI